MQLCPVPANIVDTRIGSCWQQLNRLRGVGAAVAAPAAAQTPYLG